MKETARILVLESKATDYDLVQDEIRKSLEDCTFEQVKTRKSFLQALVTFNPDVILMNYHLPRFNGMKALEVVRENAPLTPVIIWVEAANEETAVECVKAGANNYISKTNIERLAPAVIHALEDRELLLKGSQSNNPDINLDERFEALIKNGRDNISLLDKDGNLLWESPSAISTLGYSMNEFKGRNIFELIHPEDKDWTRELFAKLIQEPGRHRESVFRMMHSEGTWRWIEGTATNMLDNANVQALVINYRDVTEQREADARIRESEERFSKAFNLGPAALSISHLDGDIFLAVNEAYLKLYGYEYAEVVGHTPLELNMYPDEENSKLALKLLHEQTGFRDQEFKILTKSGEVRTVISSGEPIELGGESYMLSFSTDITERQQAEMERQALLEIMQGLASTNDLQEFLERIHNSVGKAIYAENFFVVFYQKDTGLFEEIYSVDQYDPPTPPSKLEKSITSYVFRSGEPVLMTQALFDELADQDEVELVGTNSASWLGVPLKTPNGVIGVIAVQDYENPNRYSEREKDFLASIGSQVAIAIERKLTEQTLHESEVRYRVLFENTPVAIWEEDFSDLKKHLDSLKQQGVTDFHTYFASHPDEIAQCEKMIKILDTNNTALEMYQASNKEELIKIAMEVPSKGELENSLEDMIAIAEGKTSNGWDGSDETLAGNPIEISLTWSVVPGYENDYSKVIVTTKDITKRKQAEETLHVSENRFRNLFENSPISLWEEDFSAVKSKFDMLHEQGVEDIEDYLKSNPDFVAECASSVNILDVNNATLKLFEAESKEDLVVPLNKILRPESLEFFTKELADLAAGKTSFYWEGVNRTLKGREIYVNLNLSVLPGHENTLSKVIISIFDITERKQVEERIKETSEQFRSLFEASPEAITLVDPHDDWRILDCNSMTCSMNGYTREELIGQSVNILNLTPGLPDERADYLESVREAGVLRYETFHKHKDGSVFPIEVSTSIIRLGGREVILGIDRDITERKQAEDTLYQSEQRFRALFEDVPIAIWEEDFSDVKKHIDSLKQQGISDFRAYFASRPEEMIECKKMVRIVDVNKAALKMYQADSKEELIRIAMDDFSNGELENIIEDLVAIAEGRPSHEWEGADETLKGKPIEIALTRSVAPGHEVDYSKVLVTTTDITERKRAEAALHESQIRYQSLFENSPILLWEEDYSQVKSYFDQLRSTGVTDFQKFFDDHPEAVKKCVDLVQVLDVNRASLDFMGAENKSDLLGPLSKSLNEEVYPSFKTQLVSLANGNSYYDSDEVNPGMDGGNRAIYISLSVSPEHIDTLSRVLVSIVDITDRKRVEEALRDSEERFRMLFERMLDGVYRSTHDGKFLDVNPAMVKMFGYSSKQEMLKVDIQNDLYFAPEERGGHLLDTGQEEVDVYRMRRKDGSEIWVEDHGSYIHDDEGNIIYHEGILRDITERKRADKIFDEQDMLLRESQRLAGLGHYRLDILTGEWESSETLNEVFGIDWNYQTDFDGWVHLIHPSQQDEMRIYFEEYVVGNRNPFDREYRIIRPNDGQEKWVHGMGRLEYDEQGNPTRMIGSIQDITERKLVEEETARHLLEMEALYENGLAVSRLLKPREIGNQVIGTFARHLSWHHVAIRLKESDSNNLILIALNKPGLSEAEKVEMERHFSLMVGKVGQGLSGWVVKTGQPLRTGDVHAHPQYVDTQVGIRSGLYMPLKIGERVIGVISVESERVDAFSEKDERLLATLSNQAAVAFENARLYQAAQQDLADRRRAEHALRKSEAHYRDLANSITDIMYELDQNLLFTHWNKSAEILTGVPSANALGKPLSAIFGDTREQMAIEQIYLNVLSNRSPKSFETYLNLGGEERVYEINAYPSTTGVSVVAKDVTERKLTEIIMQKRFELMNFSAKNSLEDTMQKMLDEMTTLVNSEIGFFHFMEDDQNTPGRQMWSTRTLELFDVSVSNGHHRALEQAGVWADAVRQRHPLIQNDYEAIPAKKGIPEGHRTIIRELIIPIIRNEKVVAVMGIGNKPDDYTQQDLNIAVRFADHAWDIIERKEMEFMLADERNQLAKRVEERTADLSRANSNLARALRVKDEFLANMSHELRTPLNAILGLSESLGEQTAGPLNEKQQKYITTIGESGHHLLSLINDILDLAKIDAGQITLNINKVNINSVCEASLRMVKQLALKKNQDVTLDIEDDIGLIWADERRLKQMLVNLLSNAVKFTRDYGKLGIEVRGDQQENQVSFTVWDNGLGIKDSDLSLLFQPFVQLDGGLARESTGTGLGLVLVAQMARLHGGSVAVESQPGKGSRFTITLPWEPALKPDIVQRLKDTGRLRPPETNDENKPTILLIEDTEEVTMMLHDYLENIGYQVITALDGEEGVEQAKLVHPDLILMDIQMPRVDGFEATKRLRAIPEFAHTPIIALTALAMPNDRELCLAAGMDEYISKPINLKALVKIIQSCLPGKEEQVKSQ